MESSSSVGTFGSHPPFLTLEESESQPPTAAATTTTTTKAPLTTDRHNDHHQRKLDILNWIKLGKRKFPEINGKHMVSLVMSFVVALVICDSLFVSPEYRWIKPDSSDHFLRWVQAHPYQGLGALTVVIAVAVVLMIPVGTPLTLGCGYIYRGTYGWGLGITVATIVSMGGSALGAIACFLLGRYLMRDQVRKWVRKYPLFDAIDAASAEHGLRIMAMLYLTPILPLGPVSYMCGTTSMPLSSFIIAKIASLPLMLLYVFIGASTGALISDSNSPAAGGGGNNVAQQIEQNETLIVSGIFLSVVMITGISYYIKKELYKTLDRQKKLKPGEKEGDGGGGGGDSTITSTTDEGAIELGAATSRKRRHLLPTSDSVADNES